jgi:hypothetical protein
MTGEHVPIEKSIKLIIMESRFSQEKWDFFCFSIKAEKAKPLKGKNWKLVA